MKLQIRSCLVAGVSASLILAISLWASAGNDGDDATVQHGSDNRISRGSPNVERAPTLLTAETSADSGSADEMPSAPVQWPGVMALATLGMFSLGAARRRRVPAINSWWERVPGEWYWLDVTERKGREERLAAPRATKGRADAWALQLITHVRDGDVVFHYDSSQEAITAWSVSQGRVKKEHLSWARPGTRMDAEDSIVPCWSIALRHLTRLDEPVPLDEIARVQWDLFPSLRALEDKTGTALHYLRDGRQAVDAPDCRLRLQAARGVRSEFSRARACSRFRDPNASRVPERSPGGQGIGRSSTFAYEMTPGGGSRQAHPRGRVHRGPDVRHEEGTRSP
jgi:hypothetical protein